MKHNLPSAGTSLHLRAERRTTWASHAWRPFLAAALGLWSAGAQAQHRSVGRPLAPEAVARPLKTAPVVLSADKPVRAHKGLAAISSTATGGNWSDPATWVGGAVPALTDDVTIAAGATVTLNVAATCASLTVAATGSLVTSATAGYSLQVAGSVTNNGTLDLSASATIGSELRFSGAGDAAFTGTGTTDLQTMALAKSVRADVVELNLPALTVQGGAADAKGFLFTRTTAATPADDMTGTLKISGTATISARVFGNAASYVIPTTGGFWLNNPNFTVASQTGSPTVNGLLRISAGTFNVGNSTGNSLNFGSAATYTQEGGTLNTVGRFTSFTSATAAAAMTFTLSGGTINVSTVGNASGTPSFGVNGATTISGGTINLVQRSTATTPLDYYVAGTYTCTGGTVNIGTAATTTNFDFRIRGNAPGITIDNTTNAKSAQLVGQTNPLGSVLINPGTTLNLNGNLLLQIGPTLANNGTLTGTTAGSRLYFLGNVAQSVGGTGTFSPLPQVTFQNSGGGVTLNAPITTRSAAMFEGNVIKANNLTVQSSSTELAVISYGLLNPTSSAGNFDVAPTFDLSSSGLYVIYNPELAARTTGFEIPANRRLYFADFNNPQGITVAGGDLTVYGPLSSASSIGLLAGVVTTSPGNTLISGSATTVMPTGSPTAYVNGPLGIAVNSATPVTRTFAVGDAGGWRPVVVSGITAGMDQLFKATVVSGTTGGTGASPVTGLNSTRYVRLENSDKLPTTARVQLSYGGDDVIGNPATAVVAQAPTAAGAYASLGSAAAAAPTTGIISTQDITPGNDFFVIANAEGGTLTSSVAAVCAGTNSGTLTLSNNAGTVVTYESDNGTGFAPVLPLNTTSTLTFSNLTTTTTFRAVSVTTDGRTVYSTPVTVTVSPAPTAALTATTATTFCGPGTLTLVATPVAGATYQYQLNGANISGATSATYTATVAASGSYTVVVTSAGGCAVTSAPVAVTVNAVPAATFAYAGSTFCQSGTNPSPTVTGTAGGTFSSTTGLSIDPATGVIDLAASTLGTYAVTYSLTGPCPTSATASVTISSSPVATFSYASAAYCVGGATIPTPVFAAGASGGTFSASAAGLVINATTGAIDLAASTAGTYTVTNSIGASGGCGAATATASVTINAAPSASLTTTTPTTFCAGGSVVLTAPAGTGNTYQFLLNGTAISGATSLAYTATASGAYSVTVTSAGGCTATSAAITVVVNPLPTTPVLTATYNGTTTTLISSVATGNQFYFNGAIIAGATDQTYVVNGAATQLGSYTVVVTNASGCASAPSAPLVVTASKKPLAGTSMSVYPNPTHDGRLTVELTGYRKASELTVLNALGQVVFSATVPASSGTTAQPVDLTQLASGVYVLRVKTDSGLDTRRVVKQ